MGLRDRGKRLKAGQSVAAAKPATAVRSPLAEPPATKHVAEKAPRPPPRSAPKAETPKVIVESAPGSGSGEVTVQREAPAKEPVTVQARPVPKAEAAPDPTQQLSVSDMEVVPETQTPTAQATSIPVEPASTREAATVAAGPAPTQVQRTRTAKFDAVGDNASVGAGIQLKLIELLSSDTIKVAVSGGQMESAVLLMKDVQSAFPYQLNDGAVVNLVMTYTGKNLSGSLEVGCIVEGAATALRGSLGRVTEAARSAVYSAPSKWRFLPSVITLGAGAAVMIASFTMKSVMALAGWQQYGIAALGLAAAVVGVASITARIDHNAKQ